MLQTLVCINISRFSDYCLKCKCLHVYLGAMCVRVFVTNKHHTSDQHITIYIYNIRRYTKHKYIHVIYRNRTATWAAELCLFVSFCFIFDIPFGISFGALSCGHRSVIYTNTNALMNHSKIIDDFNVDLRALINTTLPCCYAPHQSFAFSAGNTRDDHIDKQKFKSTTNKTSYCTNKQKIQELFGISERAREWETIFISFDSIEVPKRRNDDTTKTTTEKQHFIERRRREYLLVSVRWRYKLI